MKGQITISWILGIGASIAIAAFGTMAATNVRTDNKIGVVQKETTTVSERVARVEEAISALKSDNVEIKKDLKEVLRLLK